MRIIVFIRMLMVTAVDGYPLEERSFDSHRAEHGNSSFQGKTCFKSLVRKEPVIANGDAPAGEHIHPQLQANVHPTEAIAPAEYPGLSQDGSGNDVSQEISD